MRELGSRIRRGLCPLLVVARMQGQMLVLIVAFVLSSGLIRTSSIRCVAARREPARVQHIHRGQRRAGQRDLKLH